MSETERLLKVYAEAVRFPEVSGFEVLEMLDIRSRLARQEEKLDPAAQALLEEADTIFLGHASSFYERVVAIGDLSALRRRAAAPCSHWWWYLENLADELTRASSSATRSPDRSEWSHRPAGQLSHPIS